MALCATRSPKQSNGYGRMNSLAAGGRSTRTICTSTCLYEHASHSLSAHRLVSTLAPTCTLVLESPQPSRSQTSWHLACLEATTVECGVGLHVKLYAPWFTCI